MEQAELVRRIYAPLGGIGRITAKHTLGKIPITTVDEPDRVCGMARRVGYTGRNSTDLAIYRLKIQVDDRIITLPMLFVVDGGVFIEYEQWSRRD
ncbi:hypothetical protein EPA93_23070 [Ktedonosporobacter rubrisoli]|uniref:Uncharacterized protein n=1 Tax=Ktedonosporobacter rubrisoli TaxID=2509675 RepID=A0A4P6JUT1_KTERU|nr:hypothetical protein [Ktedonosporobacter rubrisoli]QBD78706.1 hypothetical protein EPA93_23070 [Ktedonosporobacter rubrisoli]